MATVVTGRPTQGGTPSPTAPAAVVLVGAALVAGAVVAIGLVAGSFTGAASPQLLSDPGPVVRWGLLASRVLNDIGASMTIGLLALSAIALPVKAGKAYAPALRAAAAAASVWALAGLGQMVFGYADVAGIPLDTEGFGDQLSLFVRQFDLGRGWALTIGVAAVVALCAAGAVSVRAAGLLTLFSFVGLVPAALAGHSGSLANHHTVVTALGLHVLGVGLWVGGLVGLILMRVTAGLTGKPLALAVRRYSTLALWCFGAVALSGVVISWARLGGWGGFDSRYAALLILKAALLVLLGVAGAWHRRRGLAQVDEGRAGDFWRVAVVEVMFMGLALAFGAALSRTAPPASSGTEAIDVARTVTGYSMPPPETFARLFTVWQPDLLWLLIVGTMAALYLAGLWKLRGRGDRWPVGRTISWLAGCLVLTWTTSGGVMAYGRVLFSAHMFGHMTTSMAVPLLLVLGAPITLALRTLPVRKDGTRGAREWLLAAISSPVMRVLTHPAVVSVLFVGSLVVFYWTNLFELALTTHVGHELMHVHFLVTGYLFVSVLVGIDPLPHRPAYLLRLVMVLATMVFHAFFGVALMSTTQVIQERFFATLGRTWGQGLLDDQHLAGGIAFGVGEFPTLFIVMLVCYQWVRADDREARRRDRAADRDGDAELNAYNAMLAQIAERDRGARPPAT